MLGRNHLISEKYELWASLIMDIGLFQILAEFLTTIRALSGEFSSSLWILFLKKQTFVQSLSVQWI